MNVILPPAEERAGKYLGFDSTGAVVPQEASSDSPDAGDKTVLVQGGTIARTLSAKLAEIVSIYDFAGADDTARLLAAWDSGATVIVIPPGSSISLSTVELASTTPRTIIATGASITLTAVGVAVTLKGARHVWEGGTFNPASLGLEAHAFKVTNDAAYTNSSFAQFRNIMIWNTYRGIEIDMVAALRSIWL